MNLNRRDFLKTTAAALFFGPLIAAEGIKLQVADDRKYWGECLRMVWESTTLHHRTTPGKEFWERLFGIPISQATSGEPLLVRNDLLPHYTPIEQNPRTLLFFGHITDTHILDEESPARVVALEKYLEEIGVRSAFRPQEDLTVRVLDSMIQTFNHLASGAAPDFLLNTGDSIDNAHQNEISWFISTLEGREVDPDSGTNQDPVPGPDNDANDPFVAKGFLSKVPWYSAIGNHDVLIQGNVPPALLDLYNTIVKKIWELFVIHDPVGNYSNAVITPWSTPPDPTKLKPGTIVPDSRRRAVNGKDFIRLHLQQNSNRPITGFPRTLLNSEFGYYTAYPKPGMPIKMIVLDTALRLGTSFGAIDEVQYQEFLIPELEKAKAAKELVMVVSHHPGADIKTLDLLKKEMVDSYGKDEKLKRAITDLMAELHDQQRYISRNQIQDTLKSYPNVFAHLVGHRHAHNVSLIGQPGQGYWEIETASLIDYPQQGRLVEVVYEGNNIGAIQTCVLDHNSAQGSLAAYARYLAYLDQKSAFGENTWNGTGELPDRNTILRFPIPSDIAKKL